MFSLDVTESFICTIHDTKLGGCCPDLIYYKDLQRPRNNNTGSDTVKLKWNWFSFRLAQEWERFALVSGLSRCGQYFQRPKKICSVLTPDMSYYLLYCHFSFHVPFNKLKTSSGSDIWGEWTLRLS